MTSVRISSPHLRRTALALLLLGGALLHTSGRAAAPADPYQAGPVGNQNGYTASTQEVDPPGRVGRLSEVLGEVWLYSPEVREWVTAERNRPLTSGDRISTDTLARAELRVGSTVVRLDSNSELEVVRLDDDHLQLQLHRGASIVRLRDSELAPQFEMVTAEGRFRTDRDGAFRFDRGTRSTQATVISGQLSYEGRNQALTINDGQRAEFLFDANGRAQYAIVEPQRDAFAAWDAERDRNDRDELASHRYVSPEMTGIEELDRYGRWDQDPEYGAIWIPRDVAPGWAPYSTGRWTWVQPWGWTWVDAAPWGFAPFHYGRWVQRGSAWGWAPGRYVARPVYAPALVGWAGGRPPAYRPGASVAISIGRGPGVGWFPLAPRDRYVPGFRSSPRYERDTNWSHGPQFDRSRDHDDRNGRGGRGDGGDRNDRPSNGSPRPNVGGGPNSVTTLPPQVLGNNSGATSPALPHRPRPDDRGGSHGPRVDTPTTGPGEAIPGGPAVRPVPHPTGRPAPIPQALPQGTPAPAARPTPMVPVNPELMRNSETRNQWFESVRENQRRREAPAVRAEPVKPQVERDNGRNPQRGGDGRDVRRERPSVSGGGDPRGDRRDNAN